jgi:phenylacetate-CoA ligase
MLADLARKAYGTAVILRNLVGQGRAPYLPEDELRELRDRRVGSMVRYAAQHVPFYRDFFRQEGIDPRRIRTAEDLQLLPLIDKEMVRRQPQQFMSQSGQVQKPLGFYSSGSTGMSLTVYHDRYSLLANSAFNARIRAVIRSLIGDPLGQRIADIGHPDGVLRLLSKFVRQNRFDLFRAPRSFISISQPVERIVEAINTCQPDIISSYGSLVEALFATVEARGMVMHTPKLIIYYSDAVSAAGKRQIEDRFGVPLISEYSAVEAFKIGFLCEERTGFHVHDDLTHVRIVDAAGREVAEGETGYLVISNLVNRAMVLLNYRLGDIGSWTAELCSCGRTLRQLGRFEGRHTNVIYLQDGGFAHAAHLALLISRRMEEDRERLLQWQLIQHEPAVFEFRLATLDRGSFDRHIAGFVADLRAVLGHSATIEPSYFHERLPVSTDGRFRGIVPLGST